MKKYYFGYCLDDFVVQNMIRDTKRKADDARKKGQNIEESIWQAMAYGYIDQEDNQVVGVIRALYSAFNRKNYDEMRALWLPDDNIELMLPGFEKAVILTSYYLQITGTD